VTTSAFLGSKKLGLEIMKAMYYLAPDSLSVVIALDDRQDSRSYLDQFREFANEINKPFFVVSKNSDLDHVIQEFHPDCCFVNGYYRILKAELLSRFPIGCFGIHGSLLPKYRGGSPLVWSIINGDKSSGISLFYFDEGMDTGDIIGQKTYSINCNETIADILIKVETLSLELMQDYYLPILNNSAPRIKQDHSLATYTAIRQPIDGKINWNWTAQRVFDFIRAQTAPYPGAFCTFENGEQLTVWSASIFPYPFYGTPGQIVQLQEDGVIVSTADSTAIVLKEVQKEGQEIAIASQVLRFNDRLI
jgi:methionyl-tRNA formyltransferase